MTFIIPNQIIVTVVLAEAAVFIPIMSRRRVVRRYPTDCLHTNRQLEALGMLFNAKRVSFWDEIFS